MQDQHYDVIIIGGGPGGYVAAIRAAQLGLKTMMVEKEALGGVCLNWGCIPTKSFLHSAEIYETFQHADLFGIQTQSPHFDLEKIVRRSKDVSKKLHQGITYLMKKNQIRVLKGHGELKGKSSNLHRVVVAKEGFCAPAVILATGARPRDLPGLTPDGHTIWTARDALNPKKLPKSLLVIGSGAIGIEFSYFYNVLGSDVTVVELADQILPTEDAEIATIARKSFEKKGVRFYTQTTVQDIQKTDEKITAHLQGPQGNLTLNVDHILVAVGIVGNVENIGLETTRVRVEKNHIVVNAHNQTDEPGIYAIGDVAGPPWLAHKASHEGVVCVEAIAGHNPTEFKPDQVPGCIYSCPQIASIGLTEQKALAAGRSIRVGRFPLTGSGKAIILGEEDGLVKTIFDAQTGAFLGAHLIGPGVTELIHGLSIAKNLEAVEEDFWHTIFPHPTLSETIPESVLVAYDRGIHR